jgi:hypothetical protein
MPVAIQKSFDGLLSDTRDRLNGRLHYNRLSRRAVTFKSGLESPVHRWFRLTPSFGPDLVRQMFTEMEAQKDDLILDPFAGASTTLIEAQLLGHKAIGFEINPLLHFIGEASLHWECEPESVAAAFGQIEEIFKSVRPQVSFDTLGALGFTVPPIHNPTRWWREDILTDLLVLKRAVRDCKCAEPVRRLLTLALAGALVPDLTNVTLGRLQLHFIDRSSDAIDVMETFAREVSEIVEDLEFVRERGRWQQATLLHQDATALNGFRPTKPISLVVTSPPYPNRYSYVWNTRPHLFFFDFFSRPKQASDLDVKTIGGTWGSATSMLAKGVVDAAHPAVENVAGKVVAEIRKLDNLMANYLMRYFNLLAQQILALSPHLSPDARLAYVVGCSRLKGVYVETDVLLGQLFEELGIGLQLTRVERIRKRNSGKDLHESIVYAHRA